ncbi:MaoC/PaaZ C-terminal domain-containing protein [Nocardia sp. NPDC058705]|uniref:MaoC/PaaZ C-terminal domain-containing protein n=1 Tax=Nocardia sp. NPDC058705 TaxID=3346609 RepID=UPI0036CF153E
MSYLAGCAHTSWRLQFARLIRLIDDARAVLSNRRLLCGLVNEAAASVNLESPVAQGMLMIGIGAGYVTSWAGDPGVVAECAVRLTSPVYVPASGATVEYTGKVKAADPHRKTATIAITANQNGRKIFGRAVAVIQCADR